MYILNIFTQIIYLHILPRKMTQDTVQVDVSIKNSTYYLVKYSTYYITIYSYLFVAKIILYFYSFTIIPISINSIIFIQFLPHIIYSSMEISTSCRDVRVS